MNLRHEVATRPTPLHISGLIVGVALVGCSSESAVQAGSQSGTGTQTTGSTGTDAGITTSAGNTASTGTTGTGGASTSGAAAGGVQTSGGGATTADSTSVTTNNATTGGETATTGGETATTGGETNTTGNSGATNTTGMVDTTGSTSGGGAGGSTTTASATTGATTGGGTIDPCTVTTPLSGGTERCSNGLGDLDGGYAWEVWMDSGSNCATYYGVDAAFRQEWNLGNGGDAQARAGLFFGSTQTHDQIGTISANYNFTKPSDNDFSWVAVYGWTFEPLTEYYIVEDSSVFVPATDYEYRGSFDVDGGTYDIYYNRRMNAASPAGTTDFDQYWSIRTEQRQCGHVSISAHFNEWNSLGMNMGLLRESMLLVEALDGSGTVDFTYANVVVE